MHSAALRVGGVQPDPTSDARFVIRRMPTFVDQPVAVQLVSSWIASQTFPSPLWAIWQDGAPAYPKQDVALGSENEVDGDVGHQFAAASQTPFALQ